MFRKGFFGVMVLLVGLVLMFALAGCGDDGDPSSPPGGNGGSGDNGGNGNGNGNGNGGNVPESVLINGVEWATRNVDAPGTFAATPDDFGMLYRWGHSTGWSNTGNDPTISSPTGQVWDNNTIATGDTTWSIAKDPSPEGWRVPTVAEIETLCDGNKVQRTWDDDGCTFTDKTNGNSIFFPLTTKRRSQDGRLGQGTECFYWSSQQYQENQYSAYYLNISSVWAFVTTGTSKGDALPVRPVKQ